MTDHEYITMMKNSAGHNKDNGIGLFKLAIFGAMVLVFLVAFLFNYT